MRDKAPLFRRIACFIGIGHHWKFVKRGPRVYCVWCHRFTTIGALRRFD